MTQATHTRLATLGLAGQVILLAGAWLLPLVSEYGLIGDTISELAPLVGSVLLAIDGAGAVGLRQGRR